MTTLDEDLDDSALFCKTLIQKRKFTGTTNPNGSKQPKLNFSETLRKTNHEIQDKLNEQAVEEKMKSNQNLDSNSDLNESKSSYFGKTTKKSSSTCPLCLKSFRTDSSYSSHMKQCAKTHKMTTQQLLKALELQKKQMQERRELGLCTQKPSYPVKTISKKKKEKESEQYDLALGLAMSKSLATFESKANPPTEVPTLEEFGFTSRNLVAKQNGKKNMGGKKSILKERSEEERQKLLIEKVAVILLDENRENSNPNAQCLNDQNPQLWNLGENNEKRNWYVDGIKSLILLEEKQSGESRKSTGSENVDCEISQMSLPRNEIHKDWSKMINNSKFSDRTAKTKDGQNVYFHSLVLYARFPGMLDQNHESILGTFNLSTVLIFLQYLYCGTLNGLTRAEIKYVHDLATEFNYQELIETLNCLKNYLSVGGGSSGKPNSSPKSKSLEKGVEASETHVADREPETFKGRDLFSDNDLVDLTQNSPQLVLEEGSFDENESNAEKSYWSFIQHEKKRERLEEMKMWDSGNEKSLGIEKKSQPVEVYEGEEINLKSPSEENKALESQKILSEDSRTGDLDGPQNDDSNTNSDCIILSSASESKSQENFSKTKDSPSRTPSPINMNCEVPYFDPYDNFHCFTEEQFSPVEVLSQSLVTGDVSSESFKLPHTAEENPMRPDESGGEEKKTFGYCSTPVTVRQPSEVKSIGKNSLEKSRKRKKRDPSASRILKKSLGLHKTARISNSGSSKKKPGKKRPNSERKEFARALTNSILHELSKSSLFQSSPPRRRRRRENFVEVTPASNREEFLDDVTPSPNYSCMGESLLKEQLTKYGLKKNLAKSKAKKILRHIYEELHPLYNSETGKIVKMLPNATEGNKSKSKSKQTKNGISGKVKNNKKSANHGGPSKEAKDISDRSSESLMDCGSDDSEFENLSETLTQSVPSNPVDLPSAFCSYLEMNPEFHQKILLYEPIWLEELQKNLKETFNKRFKMSDLMDFLDQKCITFRSEVQVRNLQRRNEKRKKT